MMARHTKPWHKAAIASLPDDDVTEPAVDPVTSPVERNTARAEHEARVVEIDREIAELQAYTEQFENARDAHRVAVEQYEREVPRLASVKSETQAAVELANQAYTAVQPRLRALIVDRAKLTAGL